MRSLYLNISDHCNLQCVYCYADGGIYNNYNTNKVSIMQPEVAIKAFNLYREEIDNHLLKVIFFGGEPLIGFSTIQALVKYVKSQKHKKVFFGIVTNGININEEIARFMKDNNFRVTVSFEGDEGCQMDRPFVDGSSSYDAVMKGIRCLNNVNLDFSVRMTYTRGKIDLWKRLRALKKIGVKQIRGSLVSPTNTDADISFDDLQQYKEEILSICNHEIELLSNYLPVTLIVDQIKNERYVKKPLCCLMGITGTAIDVQGDVYPCYRLVGFSQYKLGNVTDKSTINFYWDQALKEFSQYSDCKHCEANHICEKMCYTEAKFANNNFQKPWEIRCEEFKIHYDVAKRILEREKI